MCWVTDLINYSDHCGRSRLGMKWPTFLRQLASHSPYWGIIAHQNEFKMKNLVCMLHRNRIISFSFTLMYICNVRVISLPVSSISLASISSSLLVFTYILLLFWDIISTKSPVGVPAVRDGHLVYSPPLTAV